MDMFSNSLTITCQVCRVDVKGFVAFKCDFTAFSVLSNALKSRLRKHTEWQARVDRMDI